MPLKEEIILAIDLKIDFGIHTGEFLRMYTNKGKILILTRLIFHATGKH